MATDSTELTFIRCSSCRSLVPAVSSRCRMCGAPIDTGDVKPKDSSATASSSPTVAEDEDNDPLSQYLADLAGEDMDDDSDSQQDEVIPVQASDSIESIDSDDGDSDDDDDLFDLDDLIEDDLIDLEDEDEDTLEASPEDDQEEPYVDDLEEDLEDQYEIPAPVAEPVKPVSREVPSKPTSFRTESGGGAVKKGSLSFREEKAAPITAAPKAKRSQASIPAPTSTATQASSRRAAPDRSSVFEDQDIEEQLSGRKAKEFIEPNYGTDKRTSHRSSAVQASRANGHNLKSDTGGQVALEGRLCGWLVSFKSQHGEAIELREGKFFVTSSSLKSSDIVLNEPSVSTPHALLSVSSERGLQVQDLMSERGVFVREYDGTTYQREEETAILAHGDWVRFGDQEFLVTLIPTRNR